jgi:hypothetical protein
MSLKSSQKLDKDEASFVSELGWFTALAVTIAAAAAGIM